MIKIKSLYHIDLYLDTYIELNPPRYEKNNQSNALACQLYIEQKVHIIVVDLKKNYNVCLLPMQNLTID